MPSVRAGRSVVFYARYALSVALLSALALLVDWQELFEAAAALSWAPIAAAGLVLMAQVGIGAWRATAFLRLAGSKANGWSVLQIYALSVLANAFLLNFVAGAITRVVLLRRQRVDVSVSVATIIAEKVVITVALGTLGVAAALLLPFAHESVTPSYWDAIPVLAAGVVAIAAAALTAPWWGRPLLRWLKGWPRSTVDQCLAILASPRAWAIGTLATLLSLFCAWAAYTILAEAVGIAAAGPRIALVLPIVSLVASLPISIGGWGVREFSFGALMLGFGVAGEQAILVPAVASLLAVVAALLTAALLSIFRRNAA